VTTQPLWPRQRRFNSAVADATQEYLPAVPLVADCVFGQLAPKDFGLFGETPENQIK